VASRKFRILYPLFDPEWIGACRGVWWRAAELFYDLRQKLEAEIRKAKSNGK